MGLCFGLTADWEGGYCLVPTVPGVDVQGRRGPWLPCGALPCRLLSLRQRDVEPEGGRGHPHHSDRKPHVPLRDLQPWENKWEWFFW